MTHDHIVKTNWNDIRHEVFKANKKFAELIDEISPDNSYKLYVVNYPYGQIIGDATKFYYPSKEGLFSLSDADVPAALIQDLGYAKGSIPAGMLLNNCVELFIDAKPNTIPCHVYSPGRLVALPRELDTVAKFHPSGIMMMSSGVRSSFLLPGIGNDYTFSNVRRHLRLNIAAPKELYQHWSLFSQIINSGYERNDWRVSFLFLSKKWIDKIKTDSAWNKIKTYFYEQAWAYSSFHRNKVYYDYISSIILSNLNRKPDPYIASTICHLVSVMVGAAPAYAPAIDEECLPLHALQKLFIDLYKIKYHPTILQPQYLKPNLNQPVYYSFNYPSTMTFTKKYKSNTSVLQDLYELKEIASLYFSELTSLKSLCSNTTVFELAKSCNLEYFHSEPDKLGEIRSSSELVNMDKRFLYAMSKEKYSLASSGTFARGCIRININKSNTRQN